MAKVPDEVLRITKLARAWAEEKGRSLRFNEGLGGMCAIASAELYRRLVIKGHQVKIGCAEGPRGHHIVVVYRDKYILDITATQFGHAPVEIVWYRSKLHPWYWKPKDFFANDDELQMYQMRNRWTQCQWANGSKHYVV